MSLQNKYLQAPLKVRMGEVVAISRKENIATGSALIHRKIMYSLFYILRSYRKFALIFMRIRAFSCF